MTEIVRDSSTSLGMTKWLWPLAVLMLVLFLVTNLPWQLDDYDQAKQAWTSYGALVLSTHFGRSGSRDETAANRLDVGRGFRNHAIVGHRVAIAFVSFRRADRFSFISKFVARLRKRCRTHRVRGLRA